MRRYLFFLIVLASCLGSTFPMRAADGAADKPPTSAKEVEKTYRDYLDASVRKDEKTMVALLADDYTFTDPKGKTLSRIGLIGFLTQPDIKLDPYVVGDIKVRVYGEAAVLTIRCTEKGKRQGLPINTPLQCTVTLVKKEGRWVIVAEHVSPLAE